MSGAVSCSCCHRTTDLRRAPLMTGDRLDAPRQAVVCRSCFMRWADGEVLRRCSDDCGDEHVISAEALLEEGKP